MSFTQDKKVHIKSSILDAFKRRHATKYFNPELKISKEDISFLLEIASLSPSSFGMEPWKIVVVEKEKELLTPFVVGGSTQIPSCSHFIIILAAKAHLLNPGSLYQHYIFNNILQMKPENVSSLIETYNEFTHYFHLQEDHEKLEWAKKQTYILLSNILSVSSMIGIDSCPIEGFVPKDIDKLLKEQMAIDMNDYSVSVMVALGYKSGEVPPKRRQDWEDITIWK